MGLEKFIHFIINNNETIILLTVATILVLAGVVVYLNVFKSPQNEVDIGGIEETLKRILAQTNVAIRRTEEVPAEGTASQESQAANADVEALKTELEQRKKNIEELQMEVTKAKANDSSAELLAKIKDLEGKLAEYEIIEDDIADLSHFKDENARLKKELDTLKKRGGPELVDAFATAIQESPDSGEETAAPTAESKEDAASLDDLVAEAQQELKTETKPDDGKEVGQVFSADEISSKAPPAEAVAEKEAVAEPQPAPTPASPKTQTSESAKADIFAEFSSEEAPDPMAELGDIDTNKMLEELQNINVEMSVGAEAVHESPDIDKMAEEATKLGEE